MCRLGEDEGDAYVTQLCLWALNPALAFRDVAEAARSVVLTSGTLAPMASFASEVRPQGNGLSSPNALPPQLTRSCKRRMKRLSRVA